MGVEISCSLSVSVIWNGVALGEGYIYTVIPKSGAADRRSAHSVANGLYGKGRVRAVGGADYCWVTLAAPYRIGVYYRIAFVAAGAVYSLNSGVNAINRFSHTGDGVDKSISLKPDKRLGKRVVFAARGEIGE